MLDVMVAADQGCGCSNLFFRREVGIWKSTPLQPLHNLNVCSHGPQNGFRAVTDSKVKRGIEVIGVARGQRTAGKTHGGRQTPEP